MIRFGQVSKHHRKDGQIIRALDGVSLEVPAGALALVHGPSGSGKTTLINLAAGLARPTGGSIEVAGRRVDTLRPAQATALRARDVALVFQMFHLVPYLTARENVLLPTLAAPCDGADARAEALLDGLGLRKRVEHYPAELSAGERQRCALARALLHRPKVVLADEPTGNLDEESAGLVLGMLDTARQEGATVLVASHQHLERIPADVSFELREGGVRS